jgi:hypothetical protein
LRPLAAFAPSRFNLFQHLNRAEKLINDLNLKSQQKLGFEEKIGLPFELPTGVYGAMLAIWHLRSALQRRFPLQTGEARHYLRFLAWCATDGRKNYAILREIPEWDQALGRPLALPALNGDRWADGYSVAMFLSGMATYGGSLSALLGTTRARNRVARAYWRGRRHELQLPPLASWQKEDLARRFGSLGGLLTGIRLRQDAGKTDAELLAEFGLQDLAEIGWGSEAPTKRQEAKIAQLPPGIRRSPVPVPLRVVRRIAAILPYFKARATERERTVVTGQISRMARKAWQTEQPFGVNLFGYAHGEIGIGEDLRQVAAALQSQKIPVCIINFQPGSNISQADRTMDALVTTEPRYGINLFCMTGIEHTRYGCEQGLQHLKGRYNIGLWPWELADWPESCRHAYACVDEVWGISEYATQAHRHAAPRPVVPMTLPVGLVAVGEQRREDLGLPVEGFLFYFAFDINSNVARKNPEGLIEAFQKAFPQEYRDQVGLVLKISHPETRCKLWPKVRRIAQQDPRIHLIEKTLRRPELLALFQACDCLVSLHRAEGFGRCIAEALLLDKQVIATGFSGNLDYCCEPRVALVRHTMRTLSAKDYMWGDGQCWAEPDLDHAAELMRSIWKNLRETRHRDFDFSPSTVGRRYAARLEEIWEGRRER